MYELVHDQGPIDGVALRREARVELLRCYMNNVFAAAPASIQRLFGWRKDECEIAIDELSASKEIVRGVKVGDVRGEHVVLASIM